MKCAAGIIGVGLIFSGFLGLQNLNRTDPPQLPEPTVVGERELLEALRTVTRQPSDDLMTQFYSYYRTLGHFYELAMMPDFDETHAADWDREMSTARKNLDWEEMFRLCIDPEKARRYREEAKPEKEDTCSMCGNFCAVKNMNRILDGEIVSIFDE